VPSVIVRCNYSSTYISIVAGTYFSIISVMVTGTSVPLP